MEKTIENINGILAIISLIQEKYLDVSLGEYVEHYIYEDNSYKVFLDNNTTVKIHRTIAQDAEQDINYIGDDSLKRIIDSIGKY